MFNVERDHVRETTMRKRTDGLVSTPRKMTLAPRTRTRTKRDASEISKRLYFFLFCFVSFRLSFFFFLLFFFIIGKCPRVTNPNETMGSTRIEPLFERRWR